MADTVVQRVVGAVGSTDDDDRKIAERPTKRIKLPINNPLTTHDLLIFCILKDPRKHVLVYGVLSTAQAVDDYGSFSFLRSFSYVTISRNFRPGPLSFAGCPETESYSPRSQQHQTDRYRRHALH